MAFINTLKKKIINNFEIIYFEENLWQTPVITEKQIFDNFILGNNIPYNYIAFPWATYIDNKWTKSHNSLENDIKKNAKTIINKDNFYFTVVQHIEFRDYINIFKELNIKYIFTPHKLTKDIEIEVQNDIYILPISLFPVQFNNTNNFIDNNKKKYLASFVGQVIHKNNMSNIRVDIINKLQNKNMFLQINNAWFFQKNVYQDKDSNSNIKTNSTDNDENYKQIIKESKFSLCPSGTGPNSIRLWESLSFGSIPIILSDGLELPFLPEIEYNDFLLQWKENDIDKLHDYLMNIDNNTIIKMSENCIKAYNNFFSPSKMHINIMNFFNKKRNKKKIIITQYYIVNTDDKLYNEKRQIEINYCLQQNVNNEYIDEIHLLLEQDYNLNFIENNKKIKKIINGKRLSFHDVFTYSNIHLKGDICILLNADIYTDKSIEITKDIDFDNTFISLNRYEYNDNDIPSLLHGMEINDCDFKKCQSYLTPYQDAIWSQDGWIWTSPIKINDRINFKLGDVGCDNQLVYCMNKLNYKVLNCSKLICINHYDRLSIVKNDYGISKGNVSKKNATKIGCLDTYMFLENQNEIPDKYTTNINMIFVKENPKITKINFSKNISEIKLNESQIVASTSINENHKPFNVLFENGNYWEPDKNDSNPSIKFTFENIYDIVIIDIKGKCLDRNDKICGYVSEFNIEYYLNDDKIQKLYKGIEIDNANYVKRIYLDEKIKCNKLIVYPLKYKNTMALKINFYKIDYPKHNIFNILHSNIKIYNEFNSKTILDYELLNKTLKNSIDNVLLENQENVYNINTNILKETISEGICLFTYVMNRNNNIYNNITSWLKQKVDQIIILDWNSKEDMNDYINSLNDKRLLYIRVINEPYFIRTFAQNLAARFCKFDKIMKIDSDIIISDNFIESHPLNKGEFYVGEWRCGRNKNEEYLHGNTYLFLNDYFRINGYNEYIKNYGWDDSDFTIRLMLCGLTKKVFNNNYLYHVPHDENMRSQHLNTKELHSLVMTYTNKFSLKNMIWNKEYKLQEFNVFPINKKLIICDRIKNNEYQIDSTIYNNALDEATALVKSWKLI